jgi:ribosomal-protein-alanine N-acetyltransferase
VSAPRGPHLLGEPAAIVPMTAAHVDALLPYERAMFGPESWTASGYRAELADTRHRRYLAIEGADGQLLGWGGVRVLGEEAEILTVGVIPAARRRGLAVRLLTALLEQARRLGARELFLEVREDNAAARALYRREGFVEVGIRRGYYENGRVDAVVMSRRLGPDGEAARDDA